LDDRFARELSARTGAAVAFYVGGSRTAAGAPEGFQKSNLDQIVGDLAGLKEDADYLEKGRSGIRSLGQDLSVQYTRLPGEAYELGAGYAVARASARIDSPFSFFDASDDVDKASADKLLTAGVAAAAILLGLLFSFFEHTTPLRIFRREAEKLSKGESDEMQPSKFRGVYRKIAGDLNDGIDKVAASTGGQSRRATNLEDVLGDLPAQPQMAAFSVPGGELPAQPSPLSSPQPAAATPAPLPQAPVASPAPLPKPPGSAGTPAAPVAAPAPAPASAEPTADQIEAEWHGVFEQFVATKQQCGENTEGLTYEKFRKTLVKNRDALVSRHGVSQVKFAVHVKAGKAALKASPVKA